MAFTHAPHKNMQHRAETSWHTQTDRLIELNHRFFRRFNQTSLANAWLSGTGSAMNEWMDGRIEATFIGGFAPQQSGFVIID